MAISFHFDLNNRPSRQGKFAIFLRITEDKKIRRIKTSVELSRKSDWNPKSQKVRSSERNYAEWNSALDDIKEKAKATYRELQEKDDDQVSATRLIEKLQHKGAPATLLAFSKSVHQQLYTKKELGNWKKYGSFIIKLEAYINEKRRGEDIPFSNVDADFLSDFTAYLSGLKSARNKDQNLNQNTINKLQRILRAIIYRAIDAGVMKADKNPFGKGTIKKDTPAYKEKLTDAEIEAMTSVELEKGSLMWHARNAFLLSYYCAGIRAGDVIQLKWYDVKKDDEGTRLVYQMSKNHKEKNIILVDQAQDILCQYLRDDTKPCDYIFPYLDNKAKYAKAMKLADRDALPVDVKKVMFDTINAREVQINKQIRKVASLAGIEKHISFHTSRHSFATKAKRSGTDNALLKGLMNHSSLAVTEGYFKELGSAQEDEALLNIFDPEKNTQEEQILTALKGMTPEQLQTILSKLNSHE